MKIFPFKEKQNVEHKYKISAHEHGVGSAWCILRKKEQKGWHAAEFEHDLPPVTLQF